MAKIYKAEIYVLDINDCYSEDDVFCELENNTELIVHPFNMEALEIEWHDDIDLNKCGCTLEEYRKYFK